jgi:hypothetical protein
MDMADKAKTRSRPCQVHWHTAGNFVGDRWLFMLVILSRSLPPSSTTGQGQSYNACMKIQAEFDKHRPQAVVGSSRGGAVAMNINSGDARLVLLCPAWKRHRTARTVKPGAVILHSRADDVVPFADSEELVRNSGLPASALVDVGDDHRLAEPEPLRKMLEACEGGTERPTP